MSSENIYKSLELNAKVFQKQISRFYNIISTEISIEDDRYLFVKFKIEDFRQEPVKIISLLLEEYEDCISTFHIKGDILTIEIGE